MSIKIRKIRKCEFGKFFNAHPATGFLCHLADSLSWKFGLGISSHWSSPLRNCNALGNVHVKAIKVSLLKDADVRKEGGLTVTWGQTERCLGSNKFSTSTRSSISSVYLLINLSVSLLFTIWSGFPTSLTKRSLLTVSSLCMRPPDLVCVAQID